MSEKIPVIDVRSPAEFSHGHITGACNIPLFNDDERALIGTIYNRAGQSRAIEKGYEIAVPKRTDFIKMAEKISKDKKVLIHCWRGGMRSAKMAELFETSGINCTVLTGGYKAYRKKLFEDFKKIKNLIVIHGPTGCGKTEILQTLDDMGEQVIDLEEKACHRGSAFGNLGLPPQPTTMQFQNDIHFNLLQHNPARPVWVEGESINIGKVYLPDTLWELMNRSLVVRIEMEKSLRIKRIKEEYGNFPDGKLTESILKLMKRYGGDRTKHVINLVKQGNLEKAIELLLDYYDSNYLYSYEKYVKGEVITISTTTADASINAGLILDTLKKNSHPCMI